MTTPSTNPAGPSPEQSNDGDASAFATAWQSWHRSREEYLTGPYSWLSLTGIHWLQAGQPFQLDELPGTWTLADGRVIFDPEGAPNVSDEQGSILNAPIEVRSEREDHPSKIRIGDIQIELILRDGSYALRTKDPASTIRSSFTGIDHFPPNAAWKVPARAEPFSEPQTVENQAVIPGIVHRSHSIGNVIVTIDDVEYSLAVTWSRNLGNMILFHDATNGKGTYGGGRALVLGTDDLGSIDHIDFNRAFNLPCAYTPYCTCPVASNRLDIPVTAGEKVEPH